jgi:cold shock CspA family protein
MPTGQIARIPIDKTYGFIRMDSDRKDYFFHRDSYYGDWNLLVQDFRERNDIKVSFDIVSSPKGARAENVRRIE